MLIIDGSLGEGGGQILRTSLALSLLTGTAFRIERIRARRARPGLMHQHLTAVKAAARVGNAEATGAELGSQQLTFKPHRVVPGQHAFTVGTAGSATLVLQTVLPALLIAEEPSQLTLEGGTHNPQAPPYDFVEKAYLPLVRRMGPDVSARLEKPGFHPVGSGRFHVSIEPARRLEPLDLPRRGRIIATQACAMVAKLPRHIAERELNVVARKLGWDSKCLEVVEVKDAPGPGNALTLEIESEHVAEVFTGFGKRGFPAEKVARAAVREANEYLHAGVPVGRYLADQLLVPLAIAGGGRFRTLELSSHAETNIAVIRQFLDVDFRVSSLDDAGGVCEVEVWSPE